MRRYVELHAHSAYSFLDGASSPEELAAAAAVHGYPAVALTDHDGIWGSMEFAHACKGLGVRAITGAELTVDDEHASHPARREPRRLPQPLPADHARSRGNARRTCGERKPAPKPGVSLDAARAPCRGARLPLRLRARGCARRARRARRPDRRRADRPPAAGRLRPRALPGRAPAAVLAPRPRCATARSPSSRQRLGVPCVATGNVHCTPSRPRPPAGRLRRGAPALDARPDRARAARQLELRDGVARPRWRGASATIPTRSLETERIAERLRVRPHARPRLPLSRLRGPRRRPQAGRALPRAARRSATPGRAEHDEAAGRLEEELRVIRKLGLSGFFLLHHDMLELAREVAAEVRGSTRGARAASARARARLERQLDRLLPDRALAHRPDPEQAASSAAS